MKKARRVSRNCIFIALFLIYCYAFSQADQPKMAARGDNASYPITDYRKHLNPGFEKVARQSTRFIIVHTSEAGLESTLRTLSRGKKTKSGPRTKGGHAHYAIARDGRIYRILDHQFRADHAGLSMWNGIEDISAHSLGIELAAYHYGEITAQQYRALSWLVDELQAIYRIPDRDVLTHSQVSYGEKNLWFKKPHRGRKRCALNFERSKAGLDDAWLFDPDVRAGRLQGDLQVTKMFYKRGKVTAKVPPAHTISNIVSSQNTAWNIAGEDYDSPGTIYILPGRAQRTIRGDRLEKQIGWKRLPAGTQVLLNQPPGREQQRGPIFTIGSDYTAWSFAGPAYRKPSTIYFLPGDKIVAGSQIQDWDGLPSGTRLIIGYQGPMLIQAVEGKTAWGYAKKAYNHEETIYLIPGKSLVTGSQIQDFTNLPNGTQIFLKIVN